MEKLRLAVDHLRVETFELASGPARMGTVLGQEMNAEGAIGIVPKTDNAYDNTCANTCYGKYSCPGPTMCENTCYPSSPHICC